MEQRHQLDEPGRGRPLQHIMSSYGPARIFGISGQGSRTSPQTNGHPNRRVFLPDSFKMQEEPRLSQPPPSYAEILNEKQEEPNVLMNESATAYRPSVRHDRKVYKEKRHESPRLSPEETIHGDMDNLMEMLKETHLSSLQDEKRRSPSSNTFLSSRSEIFRDQAPDLDEQDSGGARRKPVATVQKGEDHVMERIDLTASHAIFFQYRLLDEIQADYPNVDIELSVGEQKSILTVKGLQSDIESLVDETTQIRDDLIEKIIQLDWQKSKLLRSPECVKYFNEKLLKNLKTTFRYLQEDKEGYACVLTSSERRQLLKSERIFHSTILVKHYKGVNWKPVKFKVIQEIGPSLPLHVVDPQHVDKLTIAIVTVEEAREKLEAILQDFNSISLPAEEIDVPKKPKITYATNRPFPKPYGAASQPTGFHKPGDFESGRDGWRGSSSHLDSGAQSNRVWTSTIKLFKDQEYLNFLFTSRHLAGMTNSGFTGKARLNMQTRVIMLHAGSLEEVKATKNYLLRQIQNLHKGAQAVNPHKNISQEKHKLDAAARQCRVQYLIHECTEMSRGTLDRLEVIVCHPAIECISADVMIIPITVGSLDMKQSVIGHLMAGLDKGVEDELREITSDPATCPLGSCISLPSTSKSTKVKEFIFIVVDSNDKSSLAEAFFGALKTVEAIEHRTVVCNLLGADIENFISVNESAQIMAGCIHDHVRNYEKCQIEKLYMCDTGFKAKVFTDTLGIRRNNMEQAVGKKMMLTCAFSQEDTQRFLNNVSWILE